MSNGGPPDARKAIEQFPGVGGGFLDTLMQLLGRPVQFDTLSAQGGPFGEFFPGQSRVTVNPARIAGSANPALQGPATLAHEVVGHGVFGQDEGQAESASRALMQLSGRSDRPLQGPGDLSMLGKLMQLLGRR